MDQKNEISIMSDEFEILIPENCGNITPKKAIKSLLVACTLGFCTIQIIVQPCNTCFQTNIYIAAISAILGYNI
jgi:hypothetical protein